MPLCSQTTSPLRRDCQFEPFLLADRGNKKTPLNTKD